MASPTDRGGNRGGNAATVETAEQKIARLEAAAAAAEQRAAEAEAKAATATAKATAVESGLHNIHMTQVGNNLVLTVDLTKIEPTAGTMGKAGKELKTNRIATSHGNYSIKLPSGGQAYFSLNVGAYPKSR